MAQIKESRHIMGWCSQARNHTGSPDAQYGIKWSGLGPARESHVWEKIEIQGGQFVNLTSVFALGKGPKSLFPAVQGSYLAKLRFMAKQYVVLYDVADKRAWLVDGLSALLHLVRASLKNDQNDAFKPHFLYQEGQIEEVQNSQQGGAEAAMAILSNPRNFSIRLYAEDIETWDEKTEVVDEEHGWATKTVESKTRTTYYRLRDRVLEIYSLLDKIIEHLHNRRSQDGIEFRLRGSPRNLLEGFDFMDVATNSTTLQPREVKFSLHESGRGWTDLVKSIQAVTLFGKGFGELITAATGDSCHPCDGCGSNISLPVNRDYLGTCVNIIQRIMDTRGSCHSVPWHLTDDIYWHCPGPLFEPCQCASERPSLSTSWKHSSGAKKKDEPSPSPRVQVLLPSSYPRLWAREFKSPGSLALQGAIMFSHNWKVPFGISRQRTGIASINNNQPPPLESGETLVHKEDRDSGLGSSLEDSSRDSDISTGPAADNSSDGTSAHHLASSPAIWQPTPPLPSTSPLAASLAMNPAPQHEVAVLWNDESQGASGTSSRKRKATDVLNGLKEKFVKWAGPEKECEGGQLTVDMRRQDLDDK